jgi:hypothetical protein
LKGN